jgi:hypothetical protein
MKSKQVYPHIYKKLYAVWVEGKAKPSVVVSSMKAAMKKRRELRHAHAVSLRGGQIFRCCIVAYDQV